MFSLISLTLSEQRFGSTIVGVGSLGSGNTNVTESQVNKLTVQWRDMQDGSDLFSLLSWHTECSDFVGRNSEIAELKKWAYSDVAVSVKFVVGEGGMGKSRLGAEFARLMQKENWSAGWADLRKAQAFPLEGAGTLLVVDYPEEQVPQFIELLKDLSGLDKTKRIRVLFLSRQGTERWDSKIALGHARTLIDPKPLILGAIDQQSAAKVFNTTLSAAAPNDFDFGPLQVSDEIMKKWMGLEKENSRTLFIMAAAVHALDNPDQELMSFKGREVIKTLANREIDRWRNEADSRGYEDKLALARILALSAIPEILSIDRLKQINDDPQTPLGIPKDKDLRQELKECALLAENNEDSESVMAPRPDIVAAVFLLDILCDDKAKAPEYIWSALETDVSANLERLARLAYDNEYVLGIREPKLSEWLTKAINDQQSRCEALKEYFSKSYIPVSLADCEVAVWENLVKQAGSEEVRAGWLNNLSVAQSENGDPSGAMESISEAVEFYRRMVKSNPERYEPYFANSLANLSNCQYTNGDFTDALESIREAAKIQRRLAELNPDRYGPELAMSLNNLSNCQNKDGDLPGALESIREAVKINRRLAELNPDRYRPELAMSLNSLSNRQDNNGDLPGALESVDNAVEIYRRLAELNPARYEPELAMSLGNLSTCQASDGGLPDALESIGEAVEIFRRLAELNPARYEPDLARSLSVEGDIVLKTDPCVAMKLQKEAEGLMRKYAEEMPDSPYSQLFDAIRMDLAQAQELCGDG